MVRKSTKTLLYAAAAVILVAFIVLRSFPMVTPAGQCPGTYIHCPGVGCVSGQDKCFPGSKGGPSKIFSKETFTSFPGSGYTSSPPLYGIIEKFVNESNTNTMTKCPDGTRTSDGKCLLQF